MMYYRDNYFIVNTPVLYLPSNDLETSTNHIIGSMGFRYQDIYVRRELQTAMRLPKSDTILFGVRTFITPITMLTDKQLLALHRLYCKIHDTNKEYHKVAIFEPIIRKYIVDIRKLNIV